MSRFPAMRRLVLVLLAAFTHGDDDQGLDQDARCYDYAVNTDCDPLRETWFANCPVTCEIHATRRVLAAAIEADKALAAKFLRLAFHDCVGGCDGCVDMNDPENRGLELPVAALEAALEPLTLAHLTRADAWSLAALVAADASQSTSPSAGAGPLDFRFDYVGRENCEDNCETCGPRAGPRGRGFPDANLHTAELLRFFEEEFGFDARRTVAIMGAHSIGSLSREHSGFHGPRGWAMSNTKLMNDYHRMLVNTRDGTPFGGRNWTLAAVDGSDRRQWEHISTTGPCRALEGGVCLPARVMIDADMALVRDLSAEPRGAAACTFGCGPTGEDDDCAGVAGVCPVASTFGVVAEFSQSGAAFIAEFEAALKAMILNGYDIGPCPAPPCAVGPRTTTTTAAPTTTTLAPTTTTTTAPKKAKKCKDNKKWTRGKKKVTCKKIKKMKAKKRTKECEKKKEGEAGGKKKTAKKACKRTCLERCRKAR